jgi:hypothetical protein
MGHGQQLHGLQRMACEASIAGLNRAKQVLTQVYLAALEHFQRIGPANRRFGMEPRRLLEGVVAVAAGNTATIALRAHGTFLQWAVAPGRAVGACCEGPALQPLRVRMQNGRQCSRRIPHHESCPHP